MFAQRLSGWFVGGARSVVLLVLTFAPLVCLRICEYRHALDEQNRTSLHLRCDDSALPAADDSLLHDVQQLLAALTEFIPAAALLALAFLSLPHAVAAPLRMRTPLRGIPAPPPRLRFA